MADTMDSDAAEALALHQEGRFSEAEAIYRRRLAADPDNPKITSLLGTLCLQTKRNAEAVELLRRATALKDDEASWHANLGVVLKALERYPEAAEALRRAIALRPDYPEALSNLGLVLHQMREFKEAIANFERAIALRPSMPGFHLNLGTTYLHLDLHEEAAAAFRSALRLNPNYPAARTNLGMALYSLGQFRAAEEELRAALVLKPDSAEAYRGLGTVLRDQGDVAGSLDCFERAVALQPDKIESLQQLLFVENYLGRGTPAQAVAEARAVAAKMPTGSGAPHTNIRDPERRLKVGFVSGDFRRHPVTQFMGHLLPHFDRQATDVTLFANQPSDDQVTTQLRKDSDAWQSIWRLGDEEAEAIIRQHGIDILIDLSGHTSYNRMPLFARRPAPVQAAWLGYSGTTGLAAIDYIIADDSVIPPGDEAHFAETPWRLPDAYLCYAPPVFSGMTATVSPPPSKANGFITFGSYNKLDKISDAAVACWSQVLLAVPRSKLLLKGATFDRDEVRRATEGRFAVHGVGAERLVLKPQNPSYVLHFQSYGEIDICLDPFPYNGTTTSWDAFWMGVPMVTLSGDRFISRVGASLLRTVGLGDLIATDVESYVAIAARLAADPARLAAIRSTLRDDLVRSPLGDAPRFVRNFEAALREMWRRWCAQAA